MKQVIVLFSIVLLLTFCKKESEPKAIDNNDDSVTTEIPFADVPALNEMVLYEVNMRAFSNDGNFAGVTNRLDSIAGMGVNVIWLMPIFPVGHVKSAGYLGSPYSVQDYNEVNSEFGTLDDLKTLIREAHKRKMAVIIDWVANHTSWDNPWISNTDWYTQDTDGNIISPEGTNWNDVADLNYSNNDMQVEMIKSMKYWINTANIDGYRCDAADFVPSAFWKRAIDSLLKIPDRKLILLAEGSRSDHYTSGFQMTYAWDFYNELVKIFSNNDVASNIFKVSKTEYSAIPSGKQKLRYITNHDQYAWVNSPVAQYGTKEGSVTAFLITSFMSAVPLIYNGQETAYPGLISFFSKNPMDWSLNIDIQLEYRKIMNVRKTLEAVNYGNIVEYDDKDVVVFKRNYNIDSLLVIANVRNKEIIYTIPTELNNSVWNDAFDKNPYKLFDQLQLKPFEYKVLIK